MKRILSYLHPFFFALYPIIELRYHNIKYVDAAALLRPVILSILFTALLWLVLKLLLGDWQRSAIITTLIIISFFSYGHVFLQIESLFGLVIRHRYLVLIYLAVLLLLGMLIVRKVRSLDTLMNFLTVTGGILVLYSIVNSLQYDYSVIQSARRSREIQNSAMKDVNVSVDTQKPDIYLILLDAHASSPMLKKQFGYDNSAFTQELEDLGFYVAECAQSNYPITKLSVTSLFYANYHQGPTLYPIYSGLVMETLRSLGYQVITFENRSNGHFSFAEDIRLSRNQMLLGRVDLNGGLSEFEIMLWQTSFARIIYDMPQLIPGFSVDSLEEVEYYEHIQQTFFMLDELKRMPEMEGPKLIFAHFLVPHPPFIFTPDGEFFWPETPQEGYISNIKFIDSQIASVVAEIIKKSKIPPIIIIMGDHGATGVPRLETPETRMSILNAYYVKDAARKNLYETITPVNTFRVVFNNYFGTSYPLLEDLSYHASKWRLFTPDNLVPNNCQIPQ